MDPFMEAIRKFGVEMANEILFIIADQNPCLTAQQLCQEFEKRVGDKLVHLVGAEGYEFVRSSPSVLSAVVRSTPANQYQPVSFFLVYMANPSESYRRTYDNQYRETALIEAWKLIRTNGLINACCENTGNSALHFLVGVPGATTPNLVRLFLQAGGDDLALQTNKKGQNILHVIAGRMRAEKNSNGDLVFGNEKIEQWNVKDRKAILGVLNEELSSAELTVLVTMQDEIGDTAMHEWALSASETVNIPLYGDVACDDEMEIASLLLDFGAQLRLPNHSGHVPLHFAFNTDVFEFLVKNCDVCHVRNDLDETPLMFMIKTIIKQALSQTCVTEYLELTTEFLERVSPKPVSVNTLLHVLELVEQCEEVRGTVEIPDTDGNSIFDIVLLSIKITSYEFFEHPRFNHLHGEDKLSKEQPVIRLRRDLVLLLEKIMSIGVAWQQNKQYPLHTLLNICPNIHDLKCVNTAIISSLVPLLQEGVDVNAVDTHGLTALDIACTLLYLQPLFYTEIINKLLQYGARRSAQSCKRVIRSSCPKRHRRNATDLAKATGTEDNITVVGKYRYFNDAPIGSGAFSAVFLAIKEEHLDDRSGTMYCSSFALKRIEKAKVKPKEITSEMKTLISLSNQCANIVKYYGVEHSEDAFFQYLCLDLMEGDLEQFVTNISVTEIFITKEKLMKAVHDIISGVKCLHVSNFIHRDIKPGNILYTTDPTVNFKIADFGLTKNMSTLSFSGSGVAMAPGTRCWMAPELISMKSREHTKESDVFSLGLVLHYLLTLGKHPFATGSEQSAYVIEKRIVDTQIHFEQVFPPETASFYQALLTKDSSKRPPAKFLNQHPFLWSEGKKIEFLKAVGDQPEAASPTKYPNSPLVQGLQMTKIGQNVQRSPWDLGIEALFAEMTRSSKKKYRTDKVIDLLRFIRNAYAHKQERSLVVQSDLNSNIFLQKYPSLVLDVFRVVQNLGFLNDVRRSNVQEVLS